MNIVSERMSGGVTLRCRSGITLWVVITFFVVSNKFHGTHNAVLKAFLVTIITRVNHSAHFVDLSNDFISVHLMNQGLFVIVSMMRKFTREDKLLLIKLLVLFESTTSGLLNSLTSFDKLTKPTYN